MNELLHYGKVEDGEVYLEDLNTYLKVLHELEGRRIQLSVEERSLSKTEKQRNTYFGIIIGKYMMNSEAFRGWTKEECDDFLGYKFRRSSKEIRRIRSGSIHHHEYIVPIHKLNRKSMSQFIDQCIIYLADEFGINVEIDGEGKE
jgi:hypothetical protein